MYIPGFSGLGQASNSVEVKRCSFVFNATLHIRSAVMWSFDFSLMERTLNSMVPGVFVSVIGFSCQPPAYGTETQSQLARKIPDECLGFFVPVISDYAAASSFLSGSPICRKSASHSALVLAVVTNVIDIPKTSLISSSAVSGKIECSLIPSV